MSASIHLRTTLLLVGFGLLAIAATLETRFVLQPESRFWIEGTSTLDDFTCAAADVAGYGLVREAGVAAEVRVPVRAFDCGIGRMNRDFAAALGGEAHPEIRFSLLRATVLEEPAAADAWTTVRVVGTVQLAGTTRPVAFTAQGRYLDDGRVRIQGRTPLNMTDFGVKPPSGLMGLVRAHDRVVVEFDLAAAPSNAAR